MAPFSLGGIFGGKCENTASFTKSSGDLCQTNRVVKCDSAALWWSYQSRNHSKRLRSHFKSVFFGLSFSRFHVKTTGEHACVINDPISYSVDFQQNSILSSVVTADSFLASY